MAENDSDVQKTGTSSSKKAENDSDVPKKGTSSSKKAENDSDVPQKGTSCHFLILVDSGLLIITGIS